MEIKIIVDNDAQSIKLSQQIRREVFGQEQGISTDLDIDGQDNSSFHALAYDNKTAIGVARLALHKSSHKENQAHLARVAIKQDYRGMGIATQLVNALLVKAEQLHIKYIELHAHDHLQKYYESFGFTYVGQAEQVGEHPLIKMRLNN
jgi:predicted GNAT family N-acyltransferase